MEYVYKVPPEVTRDELLSLVGSEGSLLNPLYDTDGNLIISIQEWDSGEWEYYKLEFPDIAAQFYQIEYKPLPEPPFPPR